MFINKLTHFLLILILVSLVLLLAINYQSLKIEEENQNLLSQLVSQNSGVKQSKANPRPANRNDDPYLKSQVKNTTIKNASTIQQCYNQMLVTHPDLDKGKVVMDWQINKDGKVFEIGVVRNPFDVSSFAECLEKTIKAITFPKPPFGIIKYVEHAFLFKKADQ